MSWAVLSASAGDLIVEGSAPVVAGDVGQARELATRRALVRAAEMKSARVNSSSLLRPDAVYDSIQLRSSACTKNARAIAERHQDGELTVTVGVTMNEDGECLSACRGAYTNRVLVTGFAMEFPEQKLISESGRLGQSTAVELARKIRQRHRLLSDFNASAFPYVTPGRAPEPLLAPDDHETPFASLARKHRAQYVLSGIYRDFALIGLPMLPVGRRIEIEAFLHDGANGEVLARRTFVRQAEGAALLAARPSIGSEEFYRTNLGVAWGALLDDIGAWTETQAACLPFIARVLKVAGGQIHLDSGAESGLSSGDTLTLHHWLATPVRGADGLALGREKRIRATASIRAVYPRFSIVEAEGMPPDLKITPGDVLYAQ